MKPKSQPDLCKQIREKLGTAVSATDRELETALDELAEWWWIARPTHESVPAAISPRPSLKPDDGTQLILGALDSLAVALTAHGHEWSTGERAIYDLAIERLTHRQADEGEET